MNFKNPEKRKPKDSEEEDLEEEKVEEKEQEQKEKGEELTEEGAEKEESEMQKEQIVEDAKQKQKTKEVETEEETTLLEEELEEFSPENLKTKLTPEKADIINKIIENNGYLGNSKLKEKAKTAGKKIDSETEEEVTDKGFIEKMRSSKAFKNGVKTAVAFMLLFKVQSALAVNKAQADLGIEKSKIVKQEEGTTQQEREKGAYDITKGISPDEEFPLKGKEKGEDENGSEEENGEGGGEKDGGFTLEGTTFKFPRGETDVENIKNMEEEEFEQMKTDFLENLTESIENEIKDSEGNFTGGQITITLQASASPEFKPNTNPAEYGANKDIAEGRAEEIKTALESENKALVEQIKDKLELSDEEKKKLSIEVISSSEVKFEKADSQFQELKNGNLSSEEGEQKDISDFESWLENNSFKKEFTEEELQELREVDNIQDLSSNKLKQAVADYSYQLNPEKIEKEWKSSRYIETDVEKKIQKEPPETPPELEIPPPNLNIHERDINAQHVNVIFDKSGSMSDDVKRTYETVRETFNKVKNSEDAKVKSVRTAPFRHRLTEEKSILSGNKPKIKEAKPENSEKAFNMINKVNPEDTQLSERAVKSAMEFSDYVNASEGDVLYVITDEPLQEFSIQQLEALEKSGVDVKFLVKVNSAVNSEGQEVRIEKFMGEEEKRPMLHLSQHFEEGSSEINTEDVTKLKFWEQTKSFFKEMMEKYEGDTQKVIDEFMREGGIETSIIAPDKGADSTLDKKRKEALKKLVFNNIGIIAEDAGFSMPQGQGLKAEAHYKLGEHYMGYRKQRGGFLNFTPEDLKRSAKAHILKEEDKNKLESGDNNETVEKMNKIKKDGYIFTTAPIGGWEP